VTAIQLVVVPVQIGKQVEQWL